MTLKKEVKVGIVFLLGIAALIFGLNFLKGKDVFKPVHKYYAIYSHVDGLIETCPVYLNGYKIGQVARMNYHPDNSGRIIVEFNISNREIKLPKTTVAKIVTADLLGSKAVYFEFDKNDKNYAQSGDTLVPAVQENLTAEINRQILPIKLKAENLISQFDSLIMTVNIILGDKNNQNNISKSFENIQKTFANLEKSSKHLNDLLASEKSKLSAIFEHVESIARNLKENNKQITSIIKNTADITNDLAASNIKSTIDNANKSLSAFSKTIEKINRGEGTVGALINNDTLYRSLEASAKALDALLIDMKEHPKRYVHFSVFGAKDKKTTKN